MEKKTIVRPCMDLVSKDMLYLDPADVAAKAKEDAEIARIYGECDTTAYWCELTQVGHGPDERPVDKAACSQPGRRCYKSVLDV